MVRNSIRFAIKEIKELRFQGQGKSKSSKPSGPSVRQDNSDPRIQHLVLPWMPKDYDYLAFVVNDVFTKEECDEWIAETEAKGYEEALVNAGDQALFAPKYRNSKRCIVDSHDKADKLWCKIKDFIPKEFRDLPVVGLNERLRFLRYDGGEFFKPHYDGTYTRKDMSEKSQITVQLYLNEGFEGGETTFLGPTQQEKVAVVPKIGKVLVFQHHLLHEGSLLKSGRKYSMRTDVMYKLSQ